MGTRPAIFKWWQTEPGLILCAVRWYLRYSLSLRDVEELLEERGLNVDHTTVWRWVQYYGPELEQRLRKHLKPTNKSWRVDETYVGVKGRWCYLYRAIDSRGATIDFLLSALRDADATKRLFRKALSDRSHPQPRVINTDLAPIYSSAIRDTKKEGTLRTRCRHRPVQYLNNGSVATFKRRQITACSTHICSGCQLEKVVDELNLTKKIISCHPSSLPLPDHVDCFIALNRSPSRLEFSEALLGVHSTFDGSMILFQNVV
jgi:transposase-like protein